VLIRMSRDLAEHRRQSDDGLDSEIQPMWKGVREFTLDEIQGARLTRNVGRVPRGAATQMLTAPALASFLRALRKGGDPATTTLVLWGHADGPSGVLFAHRPGIAMPPRVGRRPAAPAGSAPAPMPRPRRTVPDWHCSGLADFRMPSCRYLRPQRRQNTRLCRCFRAYFRLRVWMAISS